MEWSEYDTTSDPCSDEWGSGSFGHYRIEWSETDLGSGWAVGDGTLVVKIMQATNTSAIHKVGWSEFTGYYAIFLCNDAATGVCLEDPDIDLHTEDGSTEHEMWVAVGLTSSSNSARVADTETSTVSAGAEVVKILPDWADGNHLLLYAWDTNGGGVYSRLSTSSGWQDWNTASFESKVLVAESSDSTTNSNDAWDDIGYPWIRLAEIDGEEAVLMGVQLDTADVTDGGHGVVWGVEEEPEDFALECDNGGSECEDSACTDGALCDFEDDDANPVNYSCVMAEAGTNDMDFLAHGRFARLDRGNAILDLCNENAGWIVFNGLSDAHYQQYYVDEDVNTYPEYVYVWEYTKPSPLYCSTGDIISDCTDRWSLATDTIGDPLGLIKDAHDPASLPTGRCAASDHELSTRIYARNWGTENPTALRTAKTWTTHYTTFQGTTLTIDHTATPKFYWDDTAGGNGEVGDEIADGYECVADPARVHWPYGGGYDEGMIVTIDPDCDGGFTSGETGLVFFQLGN